jgi:hypothetical protein
MTEISDYRFDIQQFSKKAVWRAAPRQEIVFWIPIFQFNIATLAVSPPVSCRDFQYTSTVIKFRAIFLCVYFRNYKHSCQKDPIYFGLITYV